jgi:hypothetical protein
VIGVLYCINLFFDSQGKIYLQIILLNTTQGMSQLKENVNMLHIILVAAAVIIIIF